jgi:hypothetical protein
MNQLRQNMKIVRNLLDLFEKKKLKVNKNFLELATINTKQIEYVLV